MSSTSDRKGCSRVVENLERLETPPDFAESQRACKQFKPCVVQPLQSSGMDTNKRNHERAVAVQMLEAIGAFPC